jgi:hypothetical protein
VLVEGVGLVSNYRSQFHTILSTATFETLIARIRARIGELDATSRSGASERGRWGLHAHAAGALA